MARVVDRPENTMAFIKNQPLVNGKYQQKSRWSKLEKTVQFRPIFRPFGGINIPRYAEKSREMGKWSID